MATAPAASAAWAPLRQRVFRMLWLAVLASNIGTWMQTVGAQWLLVDLPSAATLVALVQTADTLPDLLLALPGGALADIFDRRRFLIGLQVFQIGVGSALAALTIAGQMTPPLLLTFTFALGAAGAVGTPAYEALIPELVPRTQIPSASALAGVSVNIARTIGPSLAGLLIARIGVGAVFVLNTAAFALLPLVLLTWRRPVEEGPESPEAFGAALRSGGRYIRYSPITRRMLLRLGLFVFPASAIWALLPLVATQRLGMAADGYGLLLGALGIGAIGGGFILPRVRQRLTNNQMLVTAATGYAAALVVLVTVRDPIVAFLALLPAGATWITVIVSINAEIQLFLPGWVRARGLATFQMVLYGSQALGALTWGLVAEYTGLTWAYLLAAAALLGGAASIRIWPLFDVDGINRDLSVHWEEPNLAIKPEHDVGPVLVTTTYTVSMGDQEKFVHAMQAVRLSRLRTGAVRWVLYQEGETGHRFVETYLVPSWGEHLRQHHVRQTGADAAIEQQARALSHPRPTVVHLFPADPLS